MNEPLSTAELLVFEERLRSSLKSLASIVDGIARNALEASGGTPFDHEEEAVEDALLHDDLGALAVADTLGYRTREALERISQHTFGTCETCEVAIDRARLAVLPHARRCVRCAAGASREG